MADDLWCYLLIQTPVESDWVSWHCSIFTERIWNTMVCHTANITNIFILVAPCLPLTLPFFIIFPYFSPKTQFGGLVEGPAAPPWPPCLTPGSRGKATLRPPAEWLESQRPADGCLDWKQEVELRGLQWLQWLNILCINYIESILSIYYRYIESTDQEQRSSAQAIQATCTAPSIPSRKESNPTTYPTSRATRTFSFLPRILLRGTDGLCSTMWLPTKLLGLQQHSASSDAAT